MAQSTAASWYAVRGQQGMTHNLLAGLQADIAISHQELVAKTERHTGADWIVLSGCKTASDMARRFRLHRATVSMLVARARLTPPAT